MSWTAHKNEEDLKEYVDEDVEKKAKKLAQMIKDSKHFIMFTGAGISTSAGPEGVWTLRAQGKTRTKKSVSSLQAIPTYTHMAIVELLNRGHLKLLISQNCDGLHRKSGVLKEQICELHGNTNLSAWNGDVHDHRTGRKCDKPNCSGGLEDSIINFGESLNPDIIGKAFRHSRVADLCLSVGSSLTVTPAANVPLTVSRRGFPYVIVNLQKTPHDKAAKMKIHGKCDEVFRIVMKELGLTPPRWFLKRKLQVDFTKDCLEVKGLDYVDSLEFDFIRAIRFFENDKFLFKKRPFKFPKFRSVLKKRKNPKKVVMEVVFFSHYSEPPMKIEFEESQAKEEETSKKKVLQFNIAYDPLTYKWSHVKAFQKPEISVVEEKKREKKPDTCILSIGNTCKRCESTERGSRFEWKMFVKEIGTKFVKKVRFKLHETFSPREVEVDEPKRMGEYSITRVGWGTFNIKGEVVFKNGQEVKFDHNLKFSDEDKAFKKTLKVTLTK